jgi:hypothetical protein
MSGRYEFFGNYQLMSLHVTSYQGKSTAYGATLVFVLAFEEWSVAFETFVLGSSAAALSRPQLL